MFNQEIIYKQIFNEDWPQIVDALHAKKAEISSDILLSQAASTFEQEFFKKVQTYSNSDELIIVLEKIYQLHNGKFYKLTTENYKNLIHELVKRKPLKEAYNYACIFPYDEICIEVIKKYASTSKETENRPNDNQKYDWIEIYNRLFELINDQSNTATYFSGPRFINTVKEFQPYFSDYNQYIALRSSQGKSTSRKIYYYDILLSLTSEIQSKVINRILEIVKPFNSTKVLAIEELLGKTPQTINLGFKDSLPTITEVTDNQPIVFISYSWDDEAHKQWVLNLANRLISDGVNILLDRYELNLGKNLQHFVENSISKADRILIIFTPNYKIKADKRQGGVGYEYSIVNADLYQHQTSNDKIIPILRLGKMLESIPSFMQQFIHLDITQDANFENSYKDLIREIFNQPALIKPPIGNKPNFLSNLVIDSSTSAKIEDSNQPFDKLQELKLKLGYEKNSTAAIAKSYDTVVSIIENSIKPLTEAWEKKLMEFDIFFFSRTSNVRADNKARSGTNILTVLKSIVGDDLPRLKDLQLAVINNLCIQCSFQRLKQHKKEVNYNGGELNVGFYQTAYEITYTGTKDSIVHLYTEQLSIKEIDTIISTISNWLTNNIEKALEKGEA